MKIKKGDAGYIRKRKQTAILKAVLEFGLVAALIVLGITQTGDRMNVLTIVAVLGCLPASKALVEVIMILPHRSMKKEKVKEISEKANLLTVAYDMVFTSEKKIMPVEGVVISGNTVCGYASNKKVNPVDVSAHLKHYLSVNGYGKVSVKIFDSYTAFVTRAEGMNNIVAIDKPDTKELEEGIRSILLNLSL